MPTENGTKLGSTGGFTAVVDRLYRSSGSTVWYAGGSTAWHEIRAVLRDLAEILVQNPQIPGGVWQIRG